LPGVGAVADRQCQSNLGQSYIIDSFMVVVFGGVGNLWGHAGRRVYARIANKFLEPVGAPSRQDRILVLIIRSSINVRAPFALKGGR